MRERTGRPDNKSRAAPASVAARLNRRCRGRDSVRRVLRSRAQSAPGEAGLEPQPPGGDEPATAQQDRGQRHRWPLRSAAQKNPNPGGAIPCLRKFATAWPAVQKVCWCNSSQICQRGFCMPKKGTEASRSAAVWFRSTPSA